MAIAPSLLGEAVEADAMYKSHSVQYDCPVAVVTAPVGTAAIIEFARKIGAEYHGECKTEEDVPELVIDFAMHRNVGPKLYTEQALYERSLS